MRIWNRCDAEGIQWRSKCKAHGPLVVGMPAPFRASGITSNRHILSNSRNCDRTACAHGDVESPDHPCLIQEQRFRSAQRLARRATPRSEFWIPTLLISRQRTANLLETMQDASAPGNEGVRVRNGSAIELPSGNINARLYLVETRSTPAD